MSDVTRTSGVNGSFPITFSQVPVEAPTLTIYSDAARTVVAVPTATLVATANPAVWTASYPATLPAGRYYLVVAAVYTAGQPAVLDQDDSLILTLATSDVSALLLTLDEARTVAPQTPGLTAEQYTAQLAQVVQAVSEHLIGQYGAPRPGTVTRVFRGYAPFILPLGATVVTVAAGSVTLTGWTYDATTGLLHDVSAYGPVSVTYTSTVPPDVREAALLTVQHAWESRQGAVPVPFQSGTDESFTVSRGFYVPNRAKELLARYGSRVG